METRVSLLLSSLIIAMTIQIMSPISSAFDLNIGYYDDTCPGAESIVKSVVSGYVYQNKGFGSGLIRMFFHDCFVRGCDTSVLLDPPSSKLDPEKNAITNNLSLRGFEVIDAVKDFLENTYPGVVSCADIIAFAAHDSAYILGGFSYDISSGSRLYPTIDPTMDPDFALFLRTQCPEDASTDDVVPQDFVTPNVFDRQYYDNVKSLEGFFFSDWSILTSFETNSLVESYSTVPGLFETNFGKSMVNMGNIGVLSSAKVRSGNHVVM
ncbi:hypothetical protein LUZ60_006951 [Juncus effusus]|nr:hypothetical protein LUZ60_006951 [Juncus effusus]